MARATPTPGHDFRSPDEKRGCPGRVGRATKVPSPLTVAAPMSTAAHLPELLSQGLVFGFVNSLHCAGMCGPLAAFFLDAPRAAIGYHTARTLAYTAVGAAAGTVGLALGAREWGHGGSWVAFVLAGALVLFAFGFERHLGKIPGAGKLVGGVVARTRRLGPGWRATALGLLTPLLPCGLLYFAYSAAVVAGGPLEGMAYMAGFALGLLPVLAFTQANLGWLHRRLGRDRLRNLARVLMLVAAAMLAWRGIADLQAAAAGAGGGCPLCETPPNG
jgi:sulfite exporter TauE/SafE